MSNTPLEQNGIDLDSVLAKVNALPQAGITPTGSITLTEEKSYDVTEKAQAIVDMSAIRANLAEAVTAKGVDTLPDSSFDTIATNIGLISGGGNAEQTKGSYTYASMSAVDVVIPHGLSGIPDVILVQSSKIGTLASHNAYRGGVISNIASLDNKLAMYVRSGTTKTEYEALGSTGYFSVDETNITLRAGTGTYHWEAGATVYWAAFKAVSE